MQNTSLRYEATPLDEGNVLAKSVNSNKISSVCGAIRSAQRNSVGPYQQVTVTPSKSLVLRKIVSGATPQKNNDLKTILQDDNTNIINHTNSQQYHNVPKFDTIKQTYYYRNLFSAQGGTFINESPSQNRTIDQRSLQNVSVSPIKQQNNTFYGNFSRDQQTFSDLSLAQKNPTFNKSHYNQIDLERKDLDNQSFLNSTQGKFSSLSKKGDPSKSLLMDIFNIKKVSEQATIDSHDHNGVFEQKQKIENEVDKMRCSMNQFFVKRRQHTSKKQNQTTNYTDNVDTSTSKNGRSLTAVGGRPSLQQQKMKQQQKTLFQNLGINNLHYMATVDNEETAGANNTSANLSMDQIKKAKNKSMQKYYKREQDFQKVYEQKLQEFRVNDTISKVPNQQQKAKNSEPLDISMYKERDDCYKVISNRIKTRALTADRKYVHKNVKILEKFFDPLRIKLRVMPQSRAPLVQGKNSDFYFVEGAKQCLKNNLTEALETIKKGLELKPTHFLCRFNHGVVLFKLGLIIEALNDFEMLTQICPKEPASYYNLAICLVQIGKYREAVDQCEKAVPLCFDDQLLYDIYQLKGICNYRLDEPILAIKDLNSAHRFQQQILNIPKLNMTTENLEFIYINLFIEETKGELGGMKNKQTMHKTSRSQSSLEKIGFDMNKFKRYNSQTLLDVQTQKDFSPIKRHTIGQLDKRQVEEFKIQQMSLDFSSATKSIQKKSPIKSNYHESPNIRQSPFKSPQSKRKLGTSPNVRSKYGRQTTNLSRQQDYELMQLKAFVGLSPNKGRQGGESESSVLEQLYYEQFKMQVSYQADQGTTLRYDRIYNCSPDKRHLDLTKEEKEEIDKRKQLEIDITDGKLIADIDTANNQNDRFLNFLLGVNEVKMREVIGTQNEYGMSQVAKDQAQLEQLMENLKQNFVEKTDKWDQEFEDNALKMDHNDQQNDTVSLFSDQNNNSNLKVEETVLEKLNQSLLQAEITPDDVSNILVRGLEDQDRQKQQEMFNNLKSAKRLTLKQVELIKEELNVDDYNERDLVKLDRQMKYLKFFKRFDRDIRHKIYLNVELLSLPAQTVIFNQGDVGDKLYIILKGRVAVQIKSADYGNLPLVVATLNDGEQFGELSLISLNRLKDGSNMTEALSMQQKANSQFARRKATCITVEQTEVLALPKDISIQLYQPAAAARKGLQKGKSLVVNRQSQSENVKKQVGPSKEDQDELNQKIQFLQSLSIFDDVDAQLLMPIACNMVPKTYNFGDYIVKEGEIPQGLFIIKSGQCKVASLRVSTRIQSDNEWMKKKLGTKKMIKDKDPLFNNFDPKSSLLNEVKNMTRGFQNDRIYVSENGQEIRDKIVYQDVMYASLRKIYYGQKALSRYYPKGIDTDVVEAETEENYQLKSLLSIIADSGTVEVYMLDKSDMGYMPDFMLRKVYEKIALLKEPDRPFHQSKVEEMKETMVKWAQYKVDCVDKMLKEKYAEKYKGKIK